MEKSRESFKTVDEYIAVFPKAVQAKLKSLRAAIKAAAPEAKERISYQMPAYWLQGNLVYFAAFKHHIGLYPTARGIAAFKRDLSRYAGGKGSVQFPIDEPLPLNLISKIVKFRVSDNTKKAKANFQKKP
ncbi:MAG: hypothetical protein HGA76_05855 [Candidatus Firestonebacteria bacterium]|nr:hypothetical protein [Candidatus Firestonebacteria bacterium]